MFLRGRTARAIAVVSMAAALSGAGMTAAWADSAAPSSCSGATVQISNVDFKVVGGDVVVTFSHTHTGCAATLHVHENLVASPKAGSDPNHQLNQDFSIGPDGPTSVSVPLLASADNKCFVQVDVHFNVNQSTGGFVPTATCTTPSSSPPSTSPTATPSTSPTATPSTSPTRVRRRRPTPTPSTSAAPAAVVTPSPSQSALPPVTIETGQQPAASRWPMSSVVVGAIAVLLILAGGLVLLVRRWGHASPK